MDLFILQFMTVTQFDHLLEMYSMLLNIKINMILTNVSKHIT